MTIEQLIGKLNTLKQIAGADAKVKVLSNKETTFGGSTYGTDIFEIRLFEYTDGVNKGNFSVCICPSPVLPRE